MSARAQTLSLAALTLVLAALYTTGTVWVLAWLAAANDYCGPIFGERPAGWRENINAMTSAEVWRQFPSTLRSENTLSIFALAFGALLPACFVPIFAMGRRAKRILIGLCFGSFVLLLLVNVATTLNPFEACSLFPGLGMVIFSVLGFGIIAAIPVLTFVVLFIRRKLNRGLPPASGSD